MEGWKGGRVLASAAAATIPLGAIAHLLPEETDLSDPVKGYAAVSRALAGPSGHDHWALLIDDLHLLDSASLVLLQQLIETGVVRVIATVRQGEPVSDAARALLRNDAMHRIDLAEFDLGATEAVLRSVLGKPMDRRTVRTLHRLSGGNGLYLRELIIGATHSGALTCNGEIWELAPGRGTTTPKLTELITDRLTNVSPAVRPVLELLALCEPVALSDAQAVAPVEALAGLEEQALIRTVVDGRRTLLLLAHPLYGEVLRAGVTPLRRRIILSAQSERLEAHGAQRRSDPLHIAGWRLTAFGTADPTLLARAAKVASHAHDYPQVIRLLEALPTPHHTVSTCLALADAYWRTGRTAEVASALVRADELAVDEKDALHITLARTAQAIWTWAPPSEVLKLNEAALGRVVSSDGRRALRVNEGCLRISMKQLDHGLRLLEDLPTQPDERYDLMAWIHGVLVKPAALAMAGRTGEAIALSEEAYAFHLKVDKDTLSFHPLMHRCPLMMALTEAGRLDEAIAIGEHTYSQLAMTDLYVRFWSAAFLARALWITGRPATARGWWAEAASLARAATPNRVLPIALAGLTACAALRGDLDGAKAAMAEGQKFMPLDGEDRLGEAWLHVASGQVEAAHVVLAEAAQVARAHGRLDSEALLLTDIARLGGAKEVAPRLAEIATQCDGELAPARARLAAALATQDPEELQAAGDVLEALGCHLPAAEAAATASAAWRRAGRPQQAVAAAQQAADRGKHCQNARTPLLGSDIAAPEPVEAPDVWSALSNREQDVARLVALGWTNREIASELYLSVKTVEYHLGNTFAKYGFANRRQLRDLLQSNSGVIA
jgi:DNA-binding CsgD family transcriptional regulator